MIVLSATDITRAYGTDVILDHISFHVNEGDRVGIVGANGAGKSTLLDILGGVSEPDEGQFFLSSDVTVGYLHQNDTFEDDCTLREEVHKIYERFEKAEKEINKLTQDIAQMAAEGKTETEKYKRVMQRYGNLQDQFERDGGFSYKSEMRGILNSMAFGEEYYDKPIASLSGGERTRLALACLLMKKPDVLMLDEPTNHLDIGMLNWLEQFLRNYKGTVIMVSHDRYFLDQLCTRIFEVAHHHLTCYDGNYTAYAQKKKQQRESDMRAYKKQQEEIRRQEDIIRK
ncbi:MAG: ABC-F family ATP-binding cassette domain-containing protein, partial [Eubacterium sp.]